MENYNILLTIKGSIKNSLDDHESVEVKTEGSFYTEDGYSCFTYNESEFYGMEGTTTVIKVKNDKEVSIIRLGIVNSSMEFNPDKRNVTLYSTPYGEISLGIITNSIDIEKEDNLITHIKIDYSIEMSNEMESKNLMDIKIKYL